MGFASHFFMKNQAPLVLSFYFKRIKELPKATPPH